ncbi:MAG: hypothetical protein WCN98_16015 [Verrucomicrobiaceae bacterium]
MQPAKEPTAADFVLAFKAIAPVHDNHIAILRTHAQAPGRVRTVTQLAEAVGYNGYEAINLQYGLLAKKIGEAMGHSNPNLSVLVEFAAPGAHNNPQWELTLRPAVAQAVSDMGWD